MTSSKDPISLEQSESAEHFSLVKQENGIAHLVIDVAGESVNTLKAEFIEQIATVLAVIKDDKSIKGLLIVSGKKLGFIAGADINMISDCQTTEQAYGLSRQGQAIFNQIEQMTIPVIAAIHGACLGGGLELAMACHHRICTDDKKTLLGLPEVQLGLLPGSGGTQRLPKLVGLQKSLDMMLTGKQLRAKQALKSGLVDDVVPASILIKCAEKIALAAPNKKNKRKVALKDQLLEGNSVGRGLIFQKALNSVLDKTQGNYPAPIKVIESVRIGMEQSSAKGYQVEAQNFAELALSKESKQLRQLFFATTELKKEQGAEGKKPKSISKVGVLGGGLMGGGIAFVSATKANTPTRIKDISHQGINQAYRLAFEQLNAKVKRRFISKNELQSQLSKITGCIDYSGYRAADMVIEAVFEDLELKQKMVADIEKYCNEQTIFASNTSSIPIAKIAEEALRPKNVIGLHYFSPVDKMPLVEVIPHEKTSLQTIATTVAFAKKQGKTPIVVKDSAGFYVNRILVPYMNEAARMILAGEPIEKVDSALVKLGFPLGPIQLLDEVGIDIGAKISPILKSELGSRFNTPDIFDVLINDNRLGKKSSKGFYLYPKTKSKEKRVDQTVYQLLNITPSASLKLSEIADRCLYLMLNEASYCLEEGIINSARDGDIGAIFGIGFPAYTGGPFRLIDSIGAKNIVDKLTEWQTLYGKHFKPSAALVKMAEEESLYY